MPGPLEHLSAVGGLSASDIQDLADMLSHNAEMTQAEHIEAPELVVAVTPLPLMDGCGVRGASARYVQDLPAMNGDHVEIAIALIFEALLLDIGVAPWELLEPSAVKGAGADGFQDFVGVHVPDDYGAVGLALKLPPAVVGE
jgi:hypothetical protein